MKYLFIENFRGFKKTFIPIENVNFFVGENSTGKTSLLSLINLLSEPRFWFEQSFNTDDVQFGHFKDIVSASSENKKYFKIGIFEFNKTEKEKPECKFFIINYKEQSGLPSADKYFYFDGSHIVKLAFNKKTVKYKIEKVKEEFYNKDGLLTTYKNLAELIQTDNQGYRLLPPSDPMPINSRLVHIPAIIASVLDGEDRPDFFKLQPMAFSYRFAWLAPIRTKPKRTYDGYESKYSSTGEHTPYILKKYLGRFSKREKLRTKLEKFGVESGLFDSIEINKFSKDDSSPFEIKIVLNGNSLRVNSVGYGVSQALPVVVEIITRPKKTCFGIQQPEVHLHPKAQAALGDLFFALAESEGKTFLIETHSDYTIDRFRRNYKNSEDQCVSSQVLFFERTKEGNSVHSIPIESNGEYCQDQPESFRQFFINEELSNLGL